MLVKARVEEGEVDQLGGEAAVTQFFASVKVGLPDVLRQRLISSGIRGKAKVLSFAASSTPSLPRSSPLRFIIANTASTVQKTPTRQTAGISGRAREPGRIVTALSTSIRTAGRIRLLRECPQPYERAHQQLLADDRYVAIRDNPSYKYG
ncbi:hypothetical protein B0T26DRAFT_141458 [Lasiosphaeria miniovina]|uniref:Uncharacterized protein n=1 Tax=Lasiosphaeria miniovina TaxID=1954250 RepID=A0AA40B5A6_9PEZI|nr:uncharacterized protein B0T26DRAFT_141458 [Lasiosphaeria miniovina]KAK0727628.1 hypothetical protein B0T26DRAFT_141458 [Lasiosphaeria miniovina]